LKVYTKYIIPPSFSSGYLDLDISSVASPPSFLASGSSGDVYIGDDMGEPDEIVGRWTMTDFTYPVPEPATIALLSIGMAVLAGAEVRRRRKKKAVDKS